MALIPWVLKRSMSLRCLTENKLRQQKWSSKIWGTKKWAFASRQRGEGLSKFFHLVASKDPGTKGSGFNGLSIGTDWTHAFWLMGSLNILLGCRQWGLCNHNSNRTLMWKLQCHDEASFLACRRFNLPGLHLVQFMGEQTLADTVNLVWSLPPSFPF